MTNFEFYAEDIKAVGYDFGIDKRSGEFVSCKNTPVCGNCKFDNNGNCIIEIIKWLYEEHKEQPKLTKNTRKYLELLPFKYIARDRNESVYGYYEKPIKNKYVGAWTYTKDKVKILAINKHLIDCNFSFIKWEDKEPWRVEDLLKLEVME